MVVHFSKKKGLIMDRKKKEELVIRGIKFYEESPIREESIIKVPNYSDEKLDELLKIVKDMYPTWFIN